MSKIEKETNKYMIFPDGTKYVGDFKYNRGHGKGTVTYPDGKKYVGEWKDGKPNGQVTYISPDGTKYVGDFNDGTFIEKSSRIKMDKNN